MITDPVSCEIEFVMPREKPLRHRQERLKLKDSAPQHCAIRMGDIDKLARSTLDGRVRFDDDQLVVELRLRKRVQNSTNQAELLFASFRLGNFGIPQDRNMTQDALRFGQIMSVVSHQRLAAINH